MLSQSEHTALHTWQVEWNLLWLILCSAEDLGVYTRPRLLLVADKGSFQPWLLDTDSSSNASSQIAAGVISDQELHEAMLWAAPSTESNLCDPEVAAAEGFWMDVGTNGELSIQGSGKLNDS